MSQEPNLALEIADVNLAYLILAQQMLRADKETALYRLGISEHVGELLSSMRPSQLLKIAQSGTLVCQIRSTEDAVWDLIADHANADAMNDSKPAKQMHARILQAGNHAEIFE